MTTAPEERELAANALPALGRVPDHNRITRRDCRPLERVNHDDRSNGRHSHGEGGVTRSVTLAPEHAMKLVRTGLTAAAAAVAALMIVPATAAHAASSTVVVTRGDDTIDAGADADVIDPGAGRDVVQAGAGADVLTLNDATTDVVDCGAGVDIVVADRADVLRNCENVTRV